MVRVLSLLPSATEIICALGFEESLVGRSHECDFPPEVQELPVLTEPHFEASGASGEIDRQVKGLVEQGLSLYKVDTELLAKLKPDVIVTQTQCDVCAVSEKELKAALSDWVGKPARIVSLEPNTLEDIWEDFRKVGEALGDSEAAEKLIVRTQERMAKIRQKLPPTSQWPRMACLEWLDPLMVAGNWMPQLVRAAGGLNMMGKAGKHSPYVTWEEIKKKDPEVLAILPCGFDIPRSQQEMHLLTKQPGWEQIAAVRQGRVFITDGNQYFNRPGPRLLESLEILAELLHPKIFSPRFEGKGWVRFSP